MNDLARHLWIYQAERFPLKRTIPLVVVFACAGVSLSATLSGRSVPSIGSYAVASLVAVILFAQLRIADEIKDADEDRRYRPERPVPRGLVSLRTLVRLGMAGVLIQGILAVWLSPRLLLVLCALWLWLALMSLEFFAPAWLRARPVLYLATHMMIMPMIDFFTTACEWLPRRGILPVTILPFLLLSFVNGCVLEIGRKTWSPSAECMGVDTYSKLWGPRRAAMVWIVFLLIALMLATLTGTNAHSFLPVGAACLLAVLPALHAARRFIADPTPAAQARLDAMAGIWVLVDYAAVGFLPLLWTHR